MSAFPARTFCPGPESPNMSSLDSVGRQDGPDETIERTTPTAEAFRQHENGLLPRAPRQRRRDKADRGLPPDSELVKLAMAYLVEQAKHWPKLAKNGVLPPPSEAMIAEMVADFKHRHRSGKIDLDRLADLKKHVEVLGGNYNRYSCDNSNP